VTVRFHSPALPGGFIFTTALPPDGLQLRARTSIAISRLVSSRAGGQRRQVARLRAALDQHGIPHMANDSHIIPVMIGIRVKTKMLADHLMINGIIYGQPIQLSDRPRAQNGCALLRHRCHNRCGYFDHPVNALKLALEAMRELRMA